MYKTAFTPFALEDLYNQYEGKYKYNLSSSCMPAMSLKELMDFYPEEEQQSLFEKILLTKLDYSEQFGTLNLRDSLIKNIYPSLSNDNVLATTGASEAIFLVMQNFFSEGDQIIVQKPIYQSLYQVAKDKGVEIIHWYVNAETMTWDINELEEIIQEYPKVKALVINNPNNPTGTIFSEEELKKIIELLGDRDLISDEVFLPISLKPVKPVAELYQFGVSICDLSKSYNLPGLRIGWIAAKQKKRLEKCSAHKNYLSLRNNTLSELIAPYALNKNIEITTKNKNTLQKNLDWLYSLDPDQLFFDRYKDKDSIAGLCFLAKLNAVIDLDTLISKGYFLVPGENFSNRFLNYARIGLGDDACYHLTKCRQ